MKSYNKRHFTNAVITALPIITAMLLAWWGVSYQSTLNRSHELNVISVNNSSELQEKFEQIGFSWPLSPGSTIPRVTVGSLPRDLDGVTDLELRKSLFIRALLPSILAENQRIRLIRERVQSILKNGLSVTQMSALHWLQNIKRTYRVQGDIKRPEVQQRLLRRLDEIPPALVLAQAANESGWGTSRFAIEGNNLFGIWTFQRETGLIPEARAGDLEHKVRTFPDIRASVKAYLYTLNIGKSYRELRKLRETMRHANESLDAVTLAAGLIHYSQRGTEYVDEVRAIIERNQLNFLDEVALHPLEVKLVMNLSVSTDG